LTQANPIKWFNEFVLYEDELGDCGLSQCFFRFRTMGDCFFGLLRYYLRIDEVVVRIYDTRIYHEFKKDYILREFSVRENSYNELKQKGFKFDAEFNTDHRQSDLVYAKLDVKSTFKDKVFF
jgi:type 2A phosphatase activator TIP41